MPNMTEAQVNESTALGLVRSENLDELLVEADAEAERVLAPVRQALDALDWKLRKDGSISITVRSDTAEQRAADLVGLARRTRRDHNAWWKDDPKKPAEERRPGEGWLWLVNKVQERVTSTFKKHDTFLEQVAKVADAAVSAYRAEKQRKAEREALCTEIEVAQAAIRQAVTRGHPETAKDMQLALDECPGPDEGGNPLAAANRLRETVAHALANEKARAEAVQKPEQADEIMEQAKAEVYVPPVTVPEPPKLAGYSTRKVWRAACFDLLRLVQAVAEGKAPLAVLEVNQSGLNRLADAWGGNNPPPGVRFFEESITTTRRPA